MHALVDGDEIIYRAGFSSERNIYYAVDGDMFHRYRYKKEADDSGYEKIITRKEIDSEEIAIANLINVVHTYLSGFDYDDYTIYLGKGDNFRDDIATIQPYKGDREESKKPIHYSLLKDYLVSKYIIEYTEGMESDDGMSIAQWTRWCQGLKRDSCIVTQDKDLNMVPGWHHNPVKNEKFFIEEDEAMKTFYKQMLTGDSTDNIPGMFKLTGNKATAKIKNKIDKMDDEIDMYNLVLTCYEGDVNMVEEIGNLLWMKKEKDKPYTPGERHYGVYDS